MIENPATAHCSNAEKEHHKQHRCRRRYSKKMTLDRAADIEHDRGEQRHCHVHAFKYQPKLRYHIHHQQSQNCCCHHKHCCRIKHGGLDLALDLLGFLHELRQPPQRQFQGSAQLTCLDHVYIK